MSHSKLPVNLFEVVSKTQPRSISCCMSCVEAVQTCLYSADFASDNYVGAPEGNDIHDAIRTSTCWLLPFSTPADYIHLLRHYT